MYLLANSNNQLWLSLGTCSLKYAGYKTYGSRGLKNNLLYLKFKHNYNFYHCESRALNTLPSDKLPLTLSKPNPLYVGAKTRHVIDNDNVHLIGFEFDGTACFRKGTRFGPNALRDVADDIESYSPYLDADIQEICFYDLGNLNIAPIHEHPSKETVEQQWQNASNDLNQLLKDSESKTEHPKLLTLGGEHSISYAPISYYLQKFDDLVLIHLDAHADLRDGFEGYHFSHASVIRRVLDNFGPKHQLIQYGIRSGTKAEYQWMKQHNTLKSSRAEFLNSVADIADKTPVYLTLDLDYFDPAFLPGTGTPEPGGEDFHSFIALCKLLKHKNLVGCDVVELSPPIDPTGNSDVFAAKVVRELIICLNQRG
jgi:agmatinase